MTSDDASGALDLAALTLWLDEQHPGLRRGDLRASLVAGGRSNLTYALDDDQHRWVLRRPPLGHVLATAHDMTREHRVISALGGTAVPVPATVALCPDAETSPLGAPFYVMERVEGRVLRTREDLEALPREGRRTVSEHLVDTLAELHRVDPAAVGLGDFGRPEGFMTRQVRRWSTQLDASRSRHVEGIDELRDALGATVPDQQRSTVVHGDYRLDNVLVDTADQRITAVLDWEMATLGDPLADVGLLLVYWGGGAGSQGPDALTAIAAPPGRIEGYPTGDELAERYATATGADLTPLPWYVAFGYFKLAVVLEGIHYRFAQGKTVGAGFERIGAIVPGLVDAGRQVLQALGSYDGQRA